jgi:hypothetical protein
MKWTRTISALYICALLFPGITDCKNSGLSDQNPMLVVNVELLNFPAGKPDDINKLYLIYYNNSAWSEPWLIQSTTGNQFFNPVVLSFTSVYLAVFYDANGNNIVDPGEPCIGFDNVNHSASVPPPSLTQIQFLPLELKQLDITLDFTGAFVY